MDPLTESHWSLVFANQTQRSWEMNKRTKPPQLPENTERARRIARVLTFDDAYGHDLAAGDPATAISDALNDLMHLADAEGLKFNRLLSRARWHYRAEIAPWDDEVESALRRGDIVRMTAEGGWELRPHQPPTEGD
jgi:hypothetical protein